MSRLGSCQSLYWRRMRNSKGCVRRSVSIDVAPIMSDGGRVEEEVESTARRVRGRGRGRPSKSGDRERRTAQARQNLEQADTSWAAPAVSPALPLRAPVVPLFISRDPVRPAAHWFRHASDVNHLDSDSAWIFRWSLY